MQIIAKKKKRGFTLIELLVVIAIIGILASIVLVSLSGAKKRAADARIISDMSQLRSTGEVFQGNNATYTGFCLNADVTVLQADITAQGGTSFSCNEQTGTGVGTSYCIEVALNATPQYWCIDSGLISKQYPNAASSTCAASVGVTAKCE